jgi:hypothetical protein
LTREGCLIHRGIPDGAHHKNACIIDKDVKTAKLLHDRLDELFHLIRLGLIGLKRRAFRALGLDLFDHFGRFIRRTAVTDRDIRAVCRKLFPRSPRRYRANLP